ncbi:hypothetical protein Tco_1176457 [Tanacetum coccineum]
MIAPVFVNTCLKPGADCSGLHPHSLKAWSSCSDDYEVAEGAICLIMISRGVRSLDELKLVFSRQPDFAFFDCEYSGTSENNAEFEVSVDESMGYGSFVNESKLGLKKDLNVGYGSGQLEMNLVGSAMVNCKSSKIPRSCDQDFGDRDGTGSGILLEPKRRYKDNVCAICYKKFGSAQALGSHKRVQIYFSRAYDVDGPRREFLDNKTTIRRHRDRLLWKREKGQIHERIARRSVCLSLLLEAMD